MSERKGELRALIALVQQDVVGVVGGAQEQDATTLKEWKKAVDQTTKQLKQLVEILVSVKETVAST